MSRAPASLIRVLAICLCAHTAANASQTVHTVRGGESVSSIARQYYGGYELTDLLLQYNEKADTVIQPGDSLKIPMCEIHSVRGGDTLSGLAQRYLDRPLAYREIATLNGLRPDRPLHVGQRLVIPVIVSHRLERGESLATLAKRFYGDTDLAHVLQSYNGIDDPRRLSVGQGVDIPLVSFLDGGKARQATVEPPLPEPVAVEPASPKTASVEPEKPVAPRTPQYHGKIALARKAYSLGEFARARELLEALQPDVLRDGSDVERTALLRLTAFVYVAFDLPVQACAAHRSLSRFSPKTRLDPDFVSPKIRQMLSACMENGGG